jgi:energy-coupling factor transporter ATP-binding protein EcfA2
MCLVGCPPPWDAPASCLDFDACSTGASTSSTADDTLPTTSAGDRIQTVTSDSEGSTAPGTETGVDTSASTGEPVDVPTIVDFKLSPNPITANGPITVDVTTTQASGVRMELETGEVIELDPREPGVFTGEIDVLTGLDNGPKVALLTPWENDVDGVTVPAPYEIALPTPGQQGFWETGDLIGPGQVAAMGVLPTGEVVELGTHSPMGESRCYLRRRDKGGVWGADDLIDVLPGIKCAAIDMKIDDDGEMFVLVNRQGGDGVRWWLAKFPGWGDGAENIGLGAKNEVAVAVAHHHSGMVAVCGTTPSGKTDLVDAMALLFRPNQPGEPWTFDYKPDELLPHQISEHTQDCVFADDTLALVGEAHGLYAMEGIDRDRLFILRLDTASQAAAWTVATAGVKVQSGAQAVDVDDLGRLVVAGYTCDDDCLPEGDLRIYDTETKLAWQVSLGSFPTKQFAIQDVVWSPAGYAVVATGGTSGNETAFTVRAFAPLQVEALWTFARKDLQVLHFALALAIGKYAEVYAGGFGANGYPAVAYIAG